MADKKSASKEGSGNKGSGKEGSGKKGSGRNDTGKDDTGKKSAAKKSAGKKSASGTGTAAKKRPANESAKRSSTATPNTKSGSRKSPPTEGPKAGRASDARSGADADPIAADPSPDSDGAPNPWGMPFGFGALGGPAPELPDLGDLGEFIRNQREAARLSVRRLAELANVSNPYLSQVERGLRKPSADILQQVANALRISVESLYVRAGILPDPGEQRVSTVPEAIDHDPHLTAEQKTALRGVYDSFVNN